VIARRETRKWRERSQACLPGTMSRAPTKAKAPAQRCSSGNDSGSGECEEHARASPSGKQREPFEAPFRRQGKQGRQAPALHMQAECAKTAAWFGRPLSLDVFTLLRRANSPNKSRNIRRAERRKCTRSDVWCRMRDTCTPGTSPGRFTPLLKFRRAASS